MSSVFTRQTGTIYWHFQSPLICLSNSTPMVLSAMGLGSIGPSPIAILPAPTPSLSKCPGRVLPGLLPCPCPSLLLSVKKNGLHAEKVRATQQQGPSLLPAMPLRGQSHNTPSPPVLHSAKHTGLQALLARMALETVDNLPRACGGIPTEALLPKADPRARSHARAHNQQLQPQRI